MMKNVNATCKYAELMEELQQKIDTLKDGADCFFGKDPDDVNWADVGSAAHLLDLINEASRFMGLKITED